MVQIELGNGRRIISNKTGQVINKRFDPVRLANVVYKKGESEAYWLKAEKQENY